MRLRPVARHRPAGECARQSTDLLGTDLQYTPRGMYTPTHAAAPGSSPSAGDATPPACLSSVSDSALPSRSRLPSRVPQAGGCPGTLTLVTLAYCTFGQGP